MTADLYFSSFCNVRMPGSYVRTLNSISKCHIHTSPSLVNKHLTVIVLEILTARQLTPCVRIPGRDALLFHASLNLLHGLASKTHGNSLSLTPTELIICFTLTDLAFTPCYLVYVENNSELHI